MKQLLFLHLFLFVFKIQSQTINKSKFEFIDVNTLISDLIKNDYVSNYEFSLDYDAIISLDIASIPVLKKLDPQYFEEVDLAIYRKKRKFRYDFSSNVKFKNIKTLFLNEKLFQKITKGHIDFSELESKVYFKNNRIAIFETSQSSFGSSSSSQYYCTLKNNKIYFELFSRTIACGLPAEMQLESDSLSIAVPK